MRGPAPKGIDRRFVALAVVESASHDDLLDRGGLYAALWRVQTGEVLTNVAD